MRIPISASRVAALLLLLTACGKSAEENSGPQYADSPARKDVPVYRLAVHPLHNPKKLVDSYTPLVVYLDKHISGAHFEVEASRDYEVYEKKYQARGPEFLLANPWQTLAAMKFGYRVIAMSGDKGDFKGIFLVRKDSNIRRPSDLKGKRISYPSTTALAACIMPQFFLHQHGINVMKDLDNRYVGSQDSSIANVLLGQVDAGATWPPPWRAYQKEYPEEAAQLKVAWETPPLINNAVMVRGDIPSGVVKQVKQLLLLLNQTEEGRNILDAMETARFHDVNNSSYEPVRKFIERFEREVRPVEVVR